ncbi:MAG: polyamine aminopropyltransferase [Cyclobacteriaceae bacterium]|nr:polyamine aminopropyltransferase [Cyclobacteriaceae bacterium]
MRALGRHIIAELYNCNLEKIDDVLFVEKGMLAAADKAGATVINSTFHHFSPFGVSGVIVIQESHFSIHCWPEYGYASIDIYTCGETVDPWIAYEYLKKEFNASHGSTMELSRGQSNLLSTPNTFGSASIKNKKSNPTKIKSTKNIWFTERNENIALSLKHSGERLYNYKSDFQKIEIYQTEAFGRILVLDGNIVCAEEDEYVYHEMIAHVPAFAHHDPKRILVIGGGDGGTVRELLRHKNIEHIDLVEIDEYVIKAAREFLPDLAFSLNNKNVDVKVEDGIDYVKSCNSETYDIVIVDSDDPVGPGEGLFTESFYREIYRVLKTDGIMITQSESPRFNRQIFMDVFQCYKKIFGEDNVYCYLMFLPSFPSGMWSFSFSSKGNIDPFQNLQKEKIRDFCAGNNSKYYSFDIHNSSFVLPRFVHDML